MSSQCSVQNIGLSNSTCLKPCANPSLDLEIKIDFVNRLQKFKAFLEANFLIFKNEFDLFAKQPNFFTKFPILYPLALDLITLHKRLQDYMFIDGELPLYDHKTIEQFLAATRR